MPKTVTFEIKGLSELQDKLESLPKKIANKILRQTLKDAGEIIRRAMARLAPQDTGFLEQHFSTRTKIKRADIAGSAFVGPDGKIDYPLNSLGSYETIRKKNGKVKRNIGRVAVATVARFLEFGTSKMAAKPFMTQAFESTKQQAVDKIVSDLNQLLQDAGK
jgi:HK97 gp10 family phage protein